jgi:hypothetical protein
MDTLHTVADAVPWDDRTAHPPGGKGAHAAMLETIVRLVRQPED